MSHRKFTGGVQRAYSQLTVKAVVEDGKRIIRGVATTPTTDRVGDVVLPEGAQYNLPIPFLWQHNSSQPIGWITEVTVTKAGITVVGEVAQTDEEGSLKDLLDFAWQSIQLGLVRGLSIGFNALKYAYMDDSWGIEFQEWEWLELSAVTIPANADASILAIKKLDGAVLAAIGKPAQNQKSLPVVSLSKSNQPSALGNKKTTPVVPIEPTEAGNMNIAELKKQYEATRQAKAARMMELMEASAEKGETLDASQQEEYDGLGIELKSIDAHLVRLNDMEKIQGTVAKRVEGQSATEAGNSRVLATVKSDEGKNKLKDGIGLAQVVKYLGRAKGNRWEALEMAKAASNIDERVLGVLKAAVAAGTTTNATWAGGLVGDETSLFADFVEYLRPLTILGKFGTGGVPALRKVPFRVPLIGQTTGGAGFWVGEGKAKPLTKFDFTRRVLDPLKVANIAVVTMETLRDSSPSADGIIRDQLVEALRGRLDTDFIDPSKTASAGISPASITNGVTPIHSSGNDADAVRADVKKLFSTFIAANNAPTSGVWVMSAVTALALSLMVTPLGVPVFPTIGMNGGTFQGLPVIVSEYVTHTSAGATVILMNAQDIYYADDGDFAVDFSTEASLEMSDAPTNNSGTGTGASLVSMFQTNSAAFRAERTVNWDKRRPSAVAVLDEVNWGS
jgi:HK97 family phage major capsid protein/HK97 family phage prohead protease